MERRYSPASSQSCNTPRQETSCSGRNGHATSKRPNYDGTRKGDDEPPKESPVAQKPVEAPVLCLKGFSEYVIKDKSTGHTYERIFIDYIDRRLTEITIEDGYLRERHQGFLLVMRGISATFMSLLIERVKPEPMTRTIRGGRFLLVDSFDTESDLPRLFAFFSDYGLQLLRSNTDWCIDGTFYSAAKHFDSLVTINCFVGKSALPAGYILLPNRKQPTYARAWDLIFGVEELKDVQPNSIVTDLELALVNSLSERFPGADMRLCFFHYAQAVFKNIQKHGLLEVYKIPEALNLLRGIIGLALVPPNEVSATFDRIKGALLDLIPEKVDVLYRVKLERYFAYFTATYVGEKKNGRFIRPRYAISMWNCFKRTLDGTARTNNAVEGWHSHLNELFPRSKMNFSQWFVRIQKEDERTTTLGMRHATNPAEHLRGRPSECNIRERNLLAIVTHYNDTPPAERDSLNFVTLVQYHISPTAFARLIEETDKENAESQPSSSQGSSQHSQELFPSTQLLLEDITETACASASASTATANVKPGRRLRRLSFGASYSANSGECDDDFLGGI